MDVAVLVDLAREQHHRGWDVVGSSHIEHLPPRTRIVPRSYVCCEYSVLTVRCRIVCVRG